MWRLKFAACVALALLPSWLKIPLYRLLFGYRIGRGVRIGFSPFFGVEQCRIGDYVRIGHLNLFYRIEVLDLGSRVRIGFLNLFRGGKKITICSYSSIIRNNTFNSIIESEFDNSVESVLELGTGCAIASGHWMDFSARISIGAHTMVAGRNSSFWTHFRQRGGEIRIGSHCYLGSEIRVAPDVDIPSLSIVALGSVMMGQFDLPRSLVSGNPASLVRSLNERELMSIIRKTRNDIPDEVVLESLPPDLYELYGRCPSSILSLGA